MAFAFASLARSFKAERRPRISAIQRILPCTVSIIFVWVLTWCWGRGKGDTAGRVEVEAGLEFDILEERWRKRSKVAFKFGAVACRHSTFGLVHFKNSPPRPHKLAQNTVAQARV